MHYISFDIETTNAPDSKTGVILEFGAVYDNLNNPQPMDELPTFHTYIIPEDLIYGSPYAIDMNKEIINKIAHKDKHPDYNFMKPSEVAPAFKKWLLSLKDDACNYGKCYYVNKHTDLVHFTPAGKNIASFDIPWVNRHFKFNEYFRFNVPYADPAILWYEIGDQKLPNAQICSDRAGLSGEVAHTAIEDSKMVIELMRKKMIPQSLEML